MAKVRTKFFLTCIVVMTLGLSVKNIFSQDISPKQMVMESKPQNTFFVELAGQGLAFTVNGDFRFSGTMNNMGVRAGIGYINVGKESITTIPLGLNYIMGKNGKYFELGIGATFISGDIFNSSNQSGLFTLGTMFFGYRSQPLDGGFNFRAGITALFRTASEDSFFIPYYPGISFGYTFD
ncbi:MAG TPA: hypothetical protein VI757_12115 [Bacteroidia bacterium]|nr:hypothetical protein [Bacteroidia bacterium]